MPKSIWICKPFVPQPGLGKYYFSTKGKADIFCLRALNAKPFGFQYYCYERKLTSHVAEAFKDLANVVYDSMLENPNEDSYELSDPEDLREPNPYPPGVPGVPMPPIMEEHPPK